MVVEQGRDEMELQVATFVGGMAAADETAAFGDVGGTRPLALQQVLQRDKRIAEAIEVTGCMQCCSVQMSR